ncbi:DUF6941 family protein [Agrococcus sp. KRD186]|jgi:hypothetical protein|uniref:DUF6941 family protein n=1 Tax=Agrococcus sp. KRD186 TaxID=2729730 RepID=UPI0019CFE69E|nr:hypothetical protein [Agrococcus sp. KRD186]
MRLLASFVCDAASIRENLGQILGAGVSRIRPETYPVPIGVDFFALLEVSGIGTQSATEISIALRQAATQVPVSEISATLDFPEIQRTGAETLNVPMVFPTRYMIVSEPGEYEFVLTIPGVDLVAVPLTMRPGSAHEE